MPEPGSSATILTLAAVVAGLSCCAIFTRHLALRLTAGLLAIAACYSYYRIWGVITVSYSTGAADPHWRVGLEATIRLGADLRQNVSRGP